MIYNEENLRTMFGRGLTFDQIAVELGVTRSVIAGKVKRLGLTRQIRRPNRNTMTIKPARSTEMSKSDLNEMLRKAVENTK